MPSGPTDSGDDLERMLRELQAKGWSPGKLRAARESWEDVCHDPMRRGRGGKGLPENEQPAEPPPPRKPLKPTVDVLLQRTASFPGEPPPEPEATN